MFKKSLQYVFQELTLIIIVIITLIVAATVRVSFYKAYGSIRIVFYH